MLSRILGDYNNLWCELQDWKFAPISQYTEQEVVAFWDKLIVPFVFDESNEGVSGQYLLDMHQFLCTLEQDLDYFGKYLPQELRFLKLDLDYLIQKEGTYTLSHWFSFRESGAQNLGANYVLSLYEALHFKSFGALLAKYWDLVKLAFF